MGTLRTTAVCLVILVGMVVAQEPLAIRRPIISVISPFGIRFIYQPYKGMTLFAVHYNINIPLPGVQSAQWNYDIKRQTGEVWLHENRNVLLQPGDRVYFWINVDIYGRGYQLINQVWFATGFPTQPPITNPPTTTPTTTITTTPNPPSTTDSRLTTKCIIVPTRTSPSVEKTTSSRAGTVGPTQPPTKACTSYPCLIFEDKFDTFDFSKWEHEITAGGGGNWEFQYYLNNRSNSYVRDGTLYIKPTLTTDRFGDGFLQSGRLDIWGGAPASLCTGANFYGCERVGTATNYINPIQSARLRTVNSFNFRYGKVEVEAQMPKGDWIWPAIWMLPRHEEYGIWPASGEIDIVESRGNLDLKNEKGDEMGHRHMGATLHWGPFNGANGYEKTTASKISDFGDKFHTYGVEWDESSMRLTLDGETILNVDPPKGGFWELGEFGNFLKDQSNPWRFSKNKKMAPFDKEFYLVMNVAVGGTNGFFGDNWNNARGPKPWNNQSPTAPKDFWLQKDTWYPTWNPKQNNGEDAAMKVKSVKVWKLKDN